MAAHEVKHPQWGSNFAIQTAAYVWKGKGTHGEYNVKIVHYTGIFGGSRTRKVQEYVGNGWVLTPNVDDAARAKRYYHHRCGLLKIVLTPRAKGGPAFVAMLDGHVASDFVSSEMEFCFDSDLLKNNNGKPVADVWFRGEGTRWGPLQDYDASRIVCTFADKAQMDEYLDLSARRMPKSVTCKGVTYSATGSGQYQSDDGSILPLLLVMYLMASSGDQPGFAAKHPEVQSLLDAAPQSNASGQADAGAPAADGPDYGNGPGNSDGGGENNDTSGGGYDSGDGGGGGGDGGGGGGGDD